MMNMKKRDKKVIKSSSNLMQTNKSDTIASCSDIVLWKSPLVTLYYFVKESHRFALKCWSQLVALKQHLLFLLILMVLGLFLNITNGSHQKLIDILKKNTSRFSYWIGLGILSSVGLGTGLHTFLLYLGPHIAEVTLAAYECQTVDFLEPPYPDDIICPEEEGLGVSVWSIMSKLRWACCMWGVGTAIGELPPYFMARASRLSGLIDDEEAEVEAILAGKKGSKISPVDRSKVFIHNLIHKVGFLGILLCASIPNPLFDLAGITCGHFLVPFWTFFGATLIGKAIIKMHIQKLFVIIAFSEKHVDQVVNLVENIPYIGPSIKKPFEEYLANQKLKLHASDTSTLEHNWLSWTFEKIVLIMIGYFVISIINSMAQNHYKRSIKDNRKQ
ncbi:hypothetical protein HELRODRAFT_185679 [Helobdella robusta]|uniref:Vacuole membrane protein 1 n=1 Tax=Helobdella robusta TaxID=6412 RepID=T1FN49_HELRO|nr:hypothetical protein HELRODRAFT_185679 [Helobdella robusta]ESO02843.1 hypothetical protein HELRODRAFT_185679 [Helobdella robusta]